MFNRELDKAQDRLIKEPSGEFFLSREVITNTPGPVFKHAVDTLLREAAERGLDLVQVPDRASGGVWIKWRPAAPITFRNPK